MYEGKMLTELDSLQARAVEVHVSEDVVDGIQDVRNMLAFEVLGSESEYAREIFVNDKIVALDVPAGTPVEEVENLLGKFVSDVRAALDAMPKPKSEPPAPPKQPDPAPTTQKVEKEKTELSPEDEKYIDKLINDQYLEAFDTVNLTLDPSQNVVVPDIDTVKAAVLKTLTPDLVAELKHLREPTLLLVPSLSPERLMDVVNGPACKTMPNQVNAEFYDPYPGAVRAAVEEPITFRFAITEGKQHFDAEPKDRDAAFNQRIRMRNQARMNEFAKYCRETKMSSLDAQAYMLLMIRGLRKGQPTDRISDTGFNFTLLPGEPIDEHVKGVLVAAGFWNSLKRQAGFRSDVVGGEGGFGRLRASVMAEI